ncbi:MAG: tetratricopeptide repeat protein [Planctomycetes bacterium]|nr:tetratricopeptide repeat protein [Planctomycetota bacterium]
MNTRLKQYFLLIFLVILLSPLALLAGDISLEQSLLCSDKLQSGDYDELTIDWLDYIKQNPEAPLAECLLKALPGLRPYLKSDETLVKRLEDLYNNKSVKGFNRLLITKNLVDLYTVQNRSEETAKLAKELGYIKDWAFMGPWGFTNWSSFDIPFLPEEKLDFASALIHERKELSWRILPEVSIPEPVNFFNYIPKAGAVYGIAQMELVKPEHGYLIINSATAFKLWVNSSPAFEADRLRNLLPQEFIIPVSLSAGWNRVMIKTIFGEGNGQFRMQLLDKDYKPFEGIRHENKLKLNEIATDTPPQSQPIDSSAISYYISKPERTVYDALALGLLYLFNADYDRSYACMETAGQLAPNDVYLKYYLALVCETSPLMPANYRQNKVQGLAEKILIAESKFLPAYQLKARYYETNDKPEEALSEINKALKINPGFLYGCLYGASICNKLNWEYESYEYIENAKIIAPQNPMVLSYEANRFWRNKNYEKTLEIYLGIAKQYAPAYDSLVVLYNEMGSLKEAIGIYQAMLKAKPNNPALLESLAQAFVNAEDYENALKQYAKLIELVPLEGRYQKAVGNAYFNAGKKDEAIASYQKSLELNPSDIPLRRYLKYTKPDDAKPGANGAKGDDFGKEHYIDVTSLIPSAPTRKDFPHANIVYLADQAIVRIYEDGSHSEIIHQAYRILNEEGVEKYSTVRFYGSGEPPELMEARTYRPDGQMMEPALVQKEELTMPGITINSIVEYKYRVDYPWKPYFQFNFPKFYFQDPAYDAPFLVSQLVIIAPKGFPIKYSQRNFKDKPRISEQSDTVTYSWTAVQTERLEPESNMPHIDEVLPNVMAGENRYDWDDINQLYKEFYLRRTIVTEQIKKESARLTAGKKTVKEKAEAIYYFVNELVKEGQGGESNAHGILLSHTGNRLILLKALLDATGIESHFALVRQPPSLCPEPDWDFPNYEYFTGREETAGQLLLVMQENGEPLWICGDYRYLAFGDLPDYTQGGKAFVINNRGKHQFVTIPKSIIEDRSSRMELTFLLDNSNNVSLEVNIAYAGALSSYRKNNFIAMDEKERSGALEKELGLVYQGLEVKSVSFNNLSSQSEPLVIKLKCLVNGFVTEAGEELKCRNGLSPLNLTGKFSEESSRRFPLQIKEPFYNHEKSRFLFPEGADIAWIPESATITATCGFYTLVTKQETENGKTVVSIERVIHLEPAKIMPADYPAFIEFCREVDYMETRPIRFTLKESGNGKAPPK